MGYSGEKESSILVQFLSVETRVVDLEEVAGRAAATGLCGCGGEGGGQDQRCRSVGGKRNELQLSAAQQSNSGPHHELEFSAAVREDSECP